MEKYEFKYDLSKIEKLSSFAEFYMEIGLQDFVNKKQDENKDIDLGHLLDVEMNKEDALKVKDILIYTYSNYDIIWRNNLPEFYLKPKYKRGKLIKAYANAIELEYATYAPKENNDIPKGVVLLKIKTEEEFNKELDDSVIKQGEDINEELPFVKKLAEDIKQTPSKTDK